MKLFTKITGGYVFLIRRIGEYLIIISIVLIATVAVVFPLWLLAERQPEIYTKITVYAMVAVIVVWGGAKIIRLVRVGGAVALLRRGALRLLLLLWVLIQLLGVAQPYLPVRIISLVLLFISTGLMLYARWNKRHARAP